MNEAATETDFGAEPELLLRERIHLLDPSRPVLDVGCGIGRNILWLAREGFHGDGIESDPVVANSLQTAAADFPVRVHNCSFQLFESDRPFGTVLVFGLLPVLQAREKKELLQQIVRWTGPGSLVFMTGFTNELNPGRWPGELASGEIRELLPSAKIVHHEEEIGPFHSHGDGPEHQHAWARAVFQI